MSVRNLSSLFRPKSVAVVGATEKEKVIGTVAMRNLMQGGFSGPIMPINPKRQAVAGVLAYPDVESLPVVPDLGVICGPAAEVPDQIERLGARAPKAAIVMTGGLATTLGANGRSLHANMIEAARRHDMRVLGSDSLGLMVPAIGSERQLRPPERIAGPHRLRFAIRALCNAVLDWARPKGESDFRISSRWATWPMSTSATCWITWGPIPRPAPSCSISNRSWSAPKFHVRRTGRGPQQTGPGHQSRPPGRRRQGGRLAHRAPWPVPTPSTMRPCARAGMLRVYDLDEMFTAVETLSRSKADPRHQSGHADQWRRYRRHGRRRIGRDSAVAWPNSRPQPSKSWITALASWSSSNPVHIGSGDGERYVKALDILLEAQEVDSRAGDARTRPRSPRPARSPNMSSNRSKRIAPM